VSLPFPSPTDPRSSRAEVFLGYLDYFRSVMVSKLQGLGDDELRASRLPSGWTPLELLRHLTYVELRWLVWGFEGEPVAQPWGDCRDERWYVAGEESLADLVEALQAQGARSRLVVQSTSCRTSDGRARAGRVGHPQPSSASCSTWFRSTPATSGTSTSSAS